MVIAHVVSTYPPYKGGMGNVAAALVERTRARGHDVRVVTPATVRPWVRFGNAAWCPGIRGALEAMQPDIVHLHWPFIGGFGAVLRWRLADQRRRLVVQYHMDLVAPGWRGLAFMAYEGVGLPHAVTVADRVVCSSRDYAEHGTLAPFLPLLGDRFAEIPLGVDGVRFSPSRRPRLREPLAREEGELEGVGSAMQPTPPYPPSQREVGEQNAPAVIFVGGLDRAHAFKGLPVLLDAVTRVPELHLRIVGNGDLRAKYEQQARVFGIAGRITFLGALSDDALPDAYRAADVLVLPSTARSEAFGLVLLESMACGTPVIASDLPGVRTVLRMQDTKNTKRESTQFETAVSSCVPSDCCGLLVSPGDAGTLAERLRWCATHRDDLRAMGARARTMVETRYNLDMIAQRWCDVYQHLSV